MPVDWEYFEKARNGDEIAWKILYNKYYRLLFKIASLITGSTDAAKDLVQETFIRLINKKPRHRKGSFKSYLTVTTYRLSLKEKKRLQKNRQVDNFELLQDPVNPLDSLIKSERNSIILKIISSLPDNQRDVLILRLYGEQSYEDIARVMNLPLGTVKSRIFNAVKLCRKKIVKKGIK